MTESCFIYLGLSFLRFASQKGEILEYQEAQNAQLFLSFWVEAIHIRKSISLFSSRLRQAQGSSGWFSGTWNMQKDGVQ